MFLFNEPSYSEGLNRVIDQTSNESVKPLSPRSRKALLSRRKALISRPSVLEENRWDKSREESRPRAHTLENQRLDKLSWSGVVEWLRGYEMRICTNLLACEPAGTLLKSIYALSGAGWTSTRKPSVSFKKTVFLARKSPSCLLRYVSTWHRCDETQGTTWFRKGILSAAICKLFDTEYGVSDAPLAGAHGGYGTEQAASPFLAVCSFPVVLASRTRGLASSASHHFQHI